MYPGRIIVSEAKDIVQPRITVDKYNSRRAVLGEDVTLPCVAQGHPVPSYYWKRELQGQTIPVAIGERLSMLSAGLLKISKVLSSFSLFKISPNSKLEIFQCTEFFFFLIFLTITFIIYLKSINCLDMVYNEFN